MSKRKRGEQPERPDGSYWWTRLFVPLRGGHYHYEWLPARVEGDRVRVFGSRNSLPLDAPVLENALWHGPIEPPCREEEERASLVRERPAKRRNRKKRLEEAVDPRIWAKAHVVAEGIVDGFLSTVDSLKVYYDRHPDHRTELIEKIAGVIERAFGVRSATEEA